MRETPAAFSAAGRIDLYLVDELFQPTVIPLSENEIAGEIRTYMASLYRNAIQDGGAYIESSLLSGNEFSGGSTQIIILSSVGENNKFERKDLGLSYASAMTNCTFTSCSLSMRRDGLHSRNSYSDCDFTDFSPAKVINSNLIGCGLITLNSSRSAYEEMDMTGNFWGYDKAREMTEKGISSNLSFIHDYNDDFNKTKVDYSDYKTEPIQGVGYLGDSYYPVVAESPTVYRIGDTGQAGGIVFYDKGYYSEGWGYLEAAPADLDGFPIFGYYKAIANSGIKSLRTTTCIGSGKINTKMLVDTLGNQAYSSPIQGNGTREAEYSAKLCEDYESNGYSDWFLPSLDEFDLMYKNLDSQGLGGGSGNYYWSSSEGGDSIAWGLLVYSESLGCYERNAEFRVRPVRAF